MRNVSNLFYKDMEASRDFYCQAEITFPNGTVRQLGRDDFAMSGNGFYEGASSGSFPLGLLIPKYITLSLNNYDDRWSEYDFQWAKIFLKTKFDLSDGTTESINIGNFTVVEPEAYGIIVEITAVDDGYKLDREYSTSLLYPASLGDILRDSCLTCGVSLFSGSFENDSFVVNEKPENITHRQVVGLCAMMAGGNARFDGNNRLRVVPYDFSELESPGLDGGIFDTAESGKYQTGDSLDGGSFSPWNTGGAFDGGYFGDRHDIHVLYAFQEGLEVGTDDVVVTGVRLKGGGEEEAFYGKEGYVLSVENVLAKGKEGESARLIGDSVVGLRFRPFSGSHAPYPMAEFGDPALIIDRKNNVYKTVLTDIGFQYYALTEVSCSADSPIRNSGRYASEAAKAIVTAKKLVEKEKTERERAMEELARELAQSSGLYMTKGEQEDGSSIYYMHDKPTLEESMIVWKLTAEAFGISTDGGETYPYGLDVTGLAILNRIYAIGINCNYLTTGSFEVRKDGKEDGEIMVLMDKDTGKVILRPDVFELSSGKTIEDIAESAAAGAVDAQTQEDILGKLTDGGKDKGIYLGKDGKLYISFSAARGGSLILGGANNENGLMEIQNTSGTVAGKWDKDGACFTDTAKNTSLSINGSKIELKSPDGEMYGSISYAPEKDLFGSGINLTSQYGGVIFTVNTSQRGKPPFWTNVLSIFSEELKSSKGYSQNIVFHVKPHFSAGLDVSGRLTPDSISGLKGGISCTGNLTVGAGGESRMKGGRSVSKGLKVEDGRSWLGDGLRIDGTQTTSGGTDLILYGSTNEVYRKSSSSIRYKEVSREMNLGDISCIYGITPVLARYKDGYLAEGDERDGVYYPMLIAEDVEKCLPSAANHNADGSVEDWNVRVMVPAMLQAIKSQKEQIEALEKRLRFLEEMKGGA